MRSVLFGVGVILIVLLAIFAVSYCLAANQDKPGSNGDSTSTLGKRSRAWDKARRMSVAAFAFLTFLVTIIILSVSTLFAIRAIERKQLFQPTKLHAYKRASGIWYKLPSGGGVLHLTPNAPTTAR